jgi:putative transposase
VETGAWTVYQRPAEYYGRKPVGIYAWALLPNHLHLLVRTGARPLAHSMRSLLTGYAGAFNRRHKRGGHLCQNRYKSIVVEEAPYVLELVRYLHLNPLRAHVVPTLRSLERYPCTGHSALLGTLPRPWQATATILAQFGPTGPRARAAYRAFVAAGMPQGRRPELQGGGLVRSAGGWGELGALRRAKEAVAGEARVLGGGAFVERLWRAAQEARHPPPSPPALERVIARVCRHTGITPDELAPVLGVAPQSVYRAAVRGAAEWAPLLKR